MEDHDTSSDTTVKTWAVIIALGFPLVVAGCLTWGMFHDPSSAGQWSQLSDSWLSARHSASTVLAWLLPHAMIVAMIVLLTTVVILECINYYRFRKQS